MRIIIWQRFNQSESIFWTEILNVERIFEWFCKFDRGKNVDMSINSFEVHFAVVWWTPKAKSQEKFWYGSSQHNTSAQLNILVKIIWKFFFQVLEHLTKNELPIKELNHLYQNLSPSQKSFRVKLTWNDHFWEDKS